VRSLVTILRRDWPLLIIELAVLIAGITISFAVEEWRSERQEARAERRVWQAVHDNLAADTLALTRRIGQVRSMMQSYERLMRGVEDSLDVDMDRLLTYVSFRPTDHALEEIRQGSGSRLRNRPLVGELASLYTRDYDLAREWDNITRGFVLDRMFPYLDTHGPYVPIKTSAGVIVGLAPVYRALAPRSEFRNLVKTHFAFKEAQLTVYGRALVSARALMKKTLAPTPP
jgi:hypothetical protein